MSVELSQVILRDSLWHTHHHDLLTAGYVYADIELTSLLKGSPDIRQLNIKDGSIYLYTDSNDYSNLSALKRNSNKKKKIKSEVENLNLYNVKFVIENKPKFKYFSFDVDYVNAHIDYLPAKWEISADASIFVKQFCFNTQRGSFLRNKTLKGNIHLNYDEGSNGLTVPEQNIDISGNVVRLKGAFHFATKPGTFELEIATDNIMLREATGMLTQPISSKINLVNLDKPIQARASLVGKLKFRDTPLVNASWVVKDNRLHTPVGVIEQTSFTGTYTNEVDRSKPHNDSNSAVNVYNMKGAWNNISYVADTVGIINLIKPIVVTKIHSQFALEKINKLTNGNTFHFDKGTAYVDLHYRGGIADNDTTIPYLNGTVKIQQADITYTPRSIKFSNCSGAMKFTGSDLSFADVHVYGPKTDLEMYGAIHDFINLLYRSPDKALIDWHVKSNHIEVAEFMSFVEPAKYVTPVIHEHKTIGKQLARINKLLEQGSAKIDVKISKLDYRRFTASAIKADILLQKSDVLLNNIELNHAKGKLQLKATIAPTTVKTPFVLNANISHVDVQEMFSQFENFKQDAITDRNLRGSLNATAKISGALSKDGKILPWSLNGECSFALLDGTLKDFDPFQRIGKIIFRRRDVSNITFKKLENTLTVRGDKIDIQPMAIESSVLNIFLKGVYSFTTGTDIDLEVPLRNPKKDELLLDENLKDANKRKGIVLYLKAVDGNNGKVKIKWNRKNGERIDAD
ncbi:MAG: AsmA family protein [Bacteroidetes bacterium]|nr:AsmA family protein [Bacteroidota bacterium]